MVRPTDRSYGEVAGFVPFDGKPLSGAEVSLLPDDGRSATAVTDAQGKYELIYIRNTPGCKIGHNKVEIRTLSGEEDDTEQEGDDAPAPDSTKPKELLPAKYNDKSELEAEVEPGKNTFDWELER